MLTRLREELTFGASQLNPTGMVTKPTSSPTGGSKCISMKITQIPASKTPLKQFFSKYINVFGVNIVATSTTPDNKVIHAANVLAQYLDNDEDGNPDNAMVVKAMVAQKATLIMFRDDQEVEYYGGIVYGTLWRQFALQDLYGSETVTPDETYRGRFDASLEEVLHLVTVRGYARAYPSAWSRSRNSELGKAMIKQIADCGYAYQHSNRWPNCKGNFHYDDDTCDFGCLTHEYLYWGLTSILGAQSDPQRCRDISNEWELCTKDLVKTKDPALYALLTDPKYAFATKLPNGKYSKSC